jgi:hypothetical protein
MLNIKSKPYRLLLYTVLALLPFYFFIPNNKIDFEFYDSFVIIFSKYIYWLLIIGNSLVWLSYLLLHKLMLSKVLSWIHIGSTILITVFIMVSIFLGSYLFFPKGYYKFCDTIIRAQSVNNEDMSLLIWAILFCQLLFVINLLGGLTKRVF